MKQVLIHVGDGDDFSPKYFKITIIYNYKKKIYYLLTLLLKVYDSVSMSINVHFSSLKWLSRIVPVISNIMTQNGLTSPKINNLNVSKLFIFYILYSTYMCTKHTRVEIHIEL